MNTKALSIVLCVSTLISCDFSKSVNKDLITGLLTKGDGLSCEEVYLSIDDETILRKTFEYGEEFMLIFNNMEGFERIEGFSFPGMTLSVVSQDEDTVLFEPDLYSDLTDGADYSPLLLNSALLVADPMHSNEKYTLHVDIWDKKGNGVFTAKLDFKVEPNILINIESNEISYQEVFLFSQERGRIIIDQTASFDENIYMMFEGLEGFVSEGDMVSIGMSLSIEDSEGNLIVNEDDLMEASDFPYSEIRDRVSANFFLTGSEINNPIYCEVVIWDKRGEGSITASTQIQIEE